MTAPAAAGGIAARLIERADGRLTALRPSLPSYFGADQARDAPIMEQVEEAPTAATARSTPVNAVTAAPPQPTSATAINQAEERLLPALERHRSASDSPRSEGPVEFNPQAAEPAEAAAPGSIRPTLTQVTPSAAPSAPAPAPASGQRLMAEPVTSRRGAGLHTTPGDSLVAAINQLLGSDQPAPDQRDQSGPAPAANSASLSQVGDRAVAKDLPPASRQDRSEPALRIHIGEIVIAPEPGPPSTAERLAAPAWQPPVALAEYRAARARERR